MLISLRTLAESWPIHLKQEQLARSRGTPESDIQCWEPGIMQSHISHVDRQLEICSQWIEICHLLKPQRVPCGKHTCHDANASDTF